MVRYLTPLYGFTPSPKHRLFRLSSSMLSTLMPLASHPLTEKLTEADDGIRILFCAIFFVSFSSSAFSAPAVGLVSVGD